MRSVKKKQSASKLAEQKKLGIHLVPSKSLAPEDSSRKNGPLPQLRQEAKTCTACDLYKNATQTVFGEGPAAAKIMLVGEQPGDTEDRAGHPFIGPAGRLLDEALAEI